jgi:hypothetical protein
MPVTRLADPGPEGCATTRGGHLAYDGPRAARPVGEPVPIAGRLLSDLTDSEFS